MALRNETLRRLYHGYVPETLRGAVTARRAAPAWLAGGIVFVHVPKAAGTSINRALYGRSLGHVRALDIRRWAPASVQALPAFSVVRNPWSRLVSAYRFARAGRGQGEAAAGILHPAQYRVPAFDSFDRFVREWLAGRDIDSLDGIFRPQWRYVCDSRQQLIVEHVGRLEDLAPTYAFIARHVGDVGRFERTNTSGAELDYRALYDPDLVRRVGAIYRADIEMFGYDF